MYGWRGKIGLIVPSSNTTNEPEFYEWLPEGVSLCTSRMSLDVTTAEALERMADDAERCGELLASANVDVVVYGCTTGSLIEGPGYDEEIEKRLAAVAGVPAVATAASIKRAFDALGLSSLAITTPYLDELTERERDFLESAGYEVVAIDGLGIERNTDIGELDSRTAYRSAREIDAPAADGVFISCTNYRTFDVVRPLEADLGKPVVTSNQATLWDVLRAIDVSPSEIDLGRLFEE